MLRAVIFDLGGTLIGYQGGSPTWVDMESAAIRSFYAWLVEAGLAMPPVDTFLKTALAMVEEMWVAACDGGPSFELADFLGRTCAEYGIEVPPGMMAEGVRRYAGVIQAESRLLDGAPELLAGLKARGLKLGLISNTLWPVSLHQEDLRRFGLEGYFDATLYSGECGLWKPQPPIFQVMLNRLEVVASEAIFVGDNPQQDVVGAQRVGMRAVWIESPTASLAAIRPDATIRHLADLPAVLATWEE